MKPSIAHLSNPPPVPVHTRPKPASQKPTSQAPAVAPPSPPMTPESLQTCAIPDDLFAYERPSRADAPSPNTSSNSVSGVVRGVSGRHRGHGRGRGSMDTRGAEGSVASHYSNEAHRGRKGIPCRFFRRGRCDRGDLCEFSHAGDGNRGRSATAPAPLTALELELSRKERELQKIRAELAAAKGVVA